MRHLSRQKKWILAILLAAVALAASVRFGLPVPGSRQIGDILSKSPLFEAILPESRRFDNFTREVFRSELANDTLNMHYTIADTKAWDLDKAKPTLGNPGLEGRKQYYSTLENYLERLGEFQYSKLTQKQQLTFTVFKDYLETELDASGMILYDEPLSPTLGIQAQLPILLAEYPFRTKKDIEDYLALLAQIPDYFQSILSFESTKSANGLFMSDVCAKEILAQCQEFIADPESNYLLEIFDEKIDRITNLTADEKIAFKNRNNELLQSCVIPSYQRLLDGLGSMLGTGTNSKGLYYYPQGTAYYEYLIHSRVGDDRPVEEIEADVKEQMIDDYAAIRDLLNSYDTKTGGNQAQNGYDTKTGENQAQGSDPDPEAMLDDLRQKITSDFPLLTDVSCTIKYVPASLQDYLSPAFYLTPAIDDYQNNVIYINPSSNYNSLELYTTLAHEGYPGHLFQSVYFCSTQPDLLRNILTTDGYVEGWATYVELYAYGLWNQDPKLASLGCRNRSFMLGLASLLDIGIHYRGYSPEQVEAFLKQLGFGADTASSLYRSILEAPANYLQYYVGYLNFRDLRDSAKEQMGSSFSLKKFHTMILDIGPAPFSILRSCLTERCRASST